MFIDMFYEKVTEARFYERFRDLGRADDFSREAITELFNFYNEIGAEEDVELDVIAICCDWSEDTPENILRDNQLNSLEDLHDITLAIELDNGNILFIR